MMKKTIAATLLIAFATALQASVPLAWKVETTRAQPMQYDVYRGETLELSASMYNRGAPLDVSGSDPCLYWQTNGMGNAYWSAPASAVSNVLSAVWAPSNDVGAAYYNCFVGSPGGSYRAAFRLRMIAAPGYTPTVLALPVQTLDYATVTVLNPPYYTTTEVDERIAASAPGNYATVSNRAMTALQSYTETDPVWIADRANYALGSSVAAAAVAGTNYTDGVATALRGEISAATPGNYSTVSNRAMTALQSYSETDPVWIADKPSITNDIAQLQTESSLIYRLYSGSNVVCEVTNYNSRVNPPTMRLMQLSESNTYFTVWAETNGLARIANAATNYTDGAIASEVTRANSAYAPRGWSATTSGLGADAPEETTWISTPTTVIAGGYEFQRNITTAGEMWILTANGMTAATNHLGFFEITAADGTSVFRVEKTDSYLVGADASAISMSGNTATVSVPVVSADHPNLRYSPSLTAPITWYKEEESELPSGVTCSWSGTSGAWVCTVTSTATSGFFTFEFLQEGSLKIINGGVLDVSKGLHYNGVKYNATPNGNKLEFIAQ